MTRRALFSFALLLLLPHCGDEEITPNATSVSTDEADAAIEAGELMERVTTSGPVSATVRVVPAAPRLGDAIVLELHVEAEADVDVELPDFGEALGRFQIVDFTPSREPGPDGGVIASQRYTLLAPMSGRQRIPPLRVVFVDRRIGALGQAQSDPDVEHELLTDEIAVEVASVLPDDADETLRPARGELPPLTASRARDPWVWVGVALLFASVLSWVVVWVRRARRAILRRSAYDVAMGRLNSLRSKGLPTPEKTDSWYVEVSDIVRRYVEDRFGLRAPELTTEEFLHEARRSAGLSPEHRSLLSTFLEQCDRVKFAAYRPPGKESLNVLADAGRFVEETRLADEER